MKTRRDHRNSTKTFGNGRRKNTKKIGREKKREVLAPTLRPSPVRAPTSSGFKPHPFGTPPLGDFTSRPPPFWTLPFCSGIFVLSHVFLSRLSCFILSRMLFLLSFFLSETKFCILSHYRPLCPCRPVYVFLFFTRPET